MEAAAVDPGEHLCGPERLLTGTLLISALLVLCGEIGKPIKNGHPPPTFSLPAFVSPRREVNLLETTQVCTESTHRSMGSVTFAL